jgi:hypothetical protein
MPVTTHTRTSAIVHTFDGHGQVMDITITQETIEFSTSGHIVLTRSESQDLLQRVDYEIRTQQWTKYQ